jgi:TonB family protein
MKKFVCAAFICICFSFAVFAQANIKVLKYEVPKYPALAQATMTSSEVVVLVKINKEGKVISSKAESGHLMFQKISEETATKWLFSKNDNLNEREIQITFAFNIKNNNSSKNNFKETKLKTRFKKPYRLEISAIMYPRINV